MPGALSDKRCLCRGLWHLRSNVTHSQRKGSVCPAPAWLSLASPGSRTGWHEMNLGHRGWDGGGNQERVAPVQCRGCLSEGCRRGTCHCPQPAVPLWDGVCAQEDARSSKGRQPRRVSLLAPLFGACSPWEVTGTHGEAGAALPAALPGAFPPAQEEGVCRQWKHRVFS